MQTIELLNKTTITQSLDHDIRKQLNDILIFKSIPSTNDYLLSYTSTEPLNAVICLAEQQSAGKGRLGRKWVSPDTANIYFSLLWPTDCDLAQLAGLNILVGVSAAQAITSVTQINDIQLKWPNDLYHHNKKLGGILIELQKKSPSGTLAVIGIGINVCMPADAAQTIEKPWTDLKKATGMTVSRNQLVAHLINQLMRNLKEFTQTGLTRFIDLWNKLDYLRHKTITIQSGDHQLHGTAHGIDQHGYLLIEINGQLRTVATGDASVKF